MQTNTEFSDISRSWHVVKSQKMLRDSDINVMEGSLAEY